MLLTILLLALAAAFFWAGYRAPPHPLQYQSKAGFYVAPRPEVKVLYAYIAREP